MSSRARLGASRSPASRASGRRPVGALPPGLRPEARLLGRTRRGAALLLVALGIPAAALGGLPAAGAVLVGGLVAGLSLNWLAHGLFALLVPASTPPSAGSAGQRAAAGRRWALASLIPRQGLLGVLLYLSIVTLGLPGAWLLAGSSVWLVALAGAAISLERFAPAPGLLAGSVRES